jgi:hypothetical protein
MIGIHSRGVDVRYLNQHKESKQQQTQERSGAHG